MTLIDRLRAHGSASGHTPTDLELEAADVLEDLQKWAVWAEQACSWGTNSATVTGSVLHKILKGEEHGNPWNTRKHA